MVYFARSNPPSRRKNASWKNLFSFIKQQDVFILPKFPPSKPKKKFASWPVSRVLYGPGLTRNVAAIHLGRHLHAASRNPPG